MTLAERLAAALARAPADGEPPIPGDPILEHAGDPMPAAVLIAITDRPEPGVLLTRRTDSLSRHAGQVAFPGGRIDTGDADAVAAALREAEEEIALPRQAAEIVGLADSYRTITGFQVMPVLAVVPADLPLRPQPGEVAAIFEPPLAFLLDPASREWRDMPWRGTTRRVMEINWEGHRIWGATAAMLVNLSRRLSSWQH
ncbi:CoA pyrophosphatase [Sphingomonas spermidinifaciens]|uniref:CoA pyrophosphatase n=1 Tax=Sphingomonas spermidinifaciens TaxID=1141889 RepID=A0A2A4B3M4_9SPHN|nr:CoA pyrophosphatase [Sphingomonas spermidinifaciens]PCD02647.1 CoA pyrophosphatase [Sphingomonas spermidinifaciens]